MSVADGWQYDPETGRRFRWISDSCREYETDFIFNGTPIAAAEPKQEQPQRYCPFKPGTAINRKCSGDCIFYVDGCRFGDQMKDSGKCPLSQVSCEKEFCGLYDNGNCRLAKRG